MSWEKQGETAACREAIYGDSQLVEIASFVLKLAPFRTGIIYSTFFPPPDRPPAVSTAFTPKANS